MERISGHESRAAGLAYTGIFVCDGGLFLDFHSADNPGDRCRHSEFLRRWDCWEENGERWRCLSIY